MFKFFDFKTYYLLILLFSCSCQSNYSDYTSKKSIAKQLTYPLIIDSLKLKDYYDSARWFIYTTHCDQAYLPKSDSSKTFTFGQLALKFNELSINNDTLELHFWFTIDNEIILPSMTRDFKQPLTGVGFNTKTKNKIYMWSPSGFTTWTKGGDDNRYEEPLQPKVLAYIIQNKDHLDSNFKLLAQLKGIIK